MCNGKSDNPIVKPPGYGKTSTLSVATLLLNAKFGKVLCSGPSNVSVDNFAERVDRTVRTAVRRYNQRRADGDLFCRRYALVVRGYKGKDEYKAFVHLLKNPLETDMSFMDRGWHTSTWRLHLSAAYWLLIVLRSQAACLQGRQLEPDDSEVLHDLRRRIDRRKDLDSLRGFATGELTLNEYSTLHSKDKTHVAALLSSIIQHADILCTTPGRSERDALIKQWKETEARAVSVDEAANMSRPDLLCIWGNTLLPCFLRGDPKQLPPTVITETETDSLGNLYNRFRNEGKISSLEFLQMTGFPIYRQLTQLRMGKGLFDWIAAIIYPEIPLEYGLSRSIEKPQFANGHKLEAYVQDKYSDIAPPPPGKLWPVFIHCEGSRVFRDELKGSKRCRDQVKATLDFAVDFVKAKEVAPSRITILTPYAANVDQIRRLLKKPEYSEALPGIPTASTIDGYGGQENDIVLVVMGTAFPRPSVGFTANARRLNVMFTRQRCGLVVFGDINIPGLRCPGDSDGPPSKFKGTHASGKGAKERAMVDNGFGSMSYSSVSELKEFYSQFSMNRRVASIIAHEKGKASDNKGKGKTGGNEAA